MKRVQKWLTSLLVVLFLVVGAQCSFAKTAEISIPSSFGEVKESFKGTSGKSVVHIQDAHCNYDAQVSIANIIKQLVAENQIDLVALEGAKGIVDTTIFQAIPDEKVKELVSDYFVRRGDINGADLASATSENNFTLWGVENKDLYFQNKNSFLSSLKYRAQLEEKTSKIKWLLSQLKEKTFSPEAKDLFATIQDYNKDRISLSSYCTYLKEVAEKNNVKWDRYENYSQIVKIVELEDSIDFSQIEAERLKVVETLEKKMKKDDVSELVSQSLYFRLGKTDAKKYYNYLSKLAKENKVDLNKQANLATYVELVNLYDEVNSDKLFSELEQIEGDVKAKVYKTKEEKDLDTYFKNISILSNLCGLKMTRKDLNYFNDHKKSFVVEKFVSFIRKEMIRQNLSFPIDEDLKVIEQVMPELERFYQLAIKRDDVMVDNLLSKMENMKSDSAVLVTGGFHSEGILERLKAQNISYTVVTPKINTIGNTEEIYLNQMTAPYGAGVGYGMLAVLDKLNPELAGNVAFPSFQQWVAGLSQNVSGAIGVDVNEYKNRFLDSFVEAMKKEKALEGITVSDADLKAEATKILEEKNIINFLGEHAVVANGVSYTFAETVVDGKTVLAVQELSIVNNQLNLRTITSVDEIKKLDVNIQSTDVAKAADVLANINSNVALDKYPNSVAVKGAFNAAMNAAFRKKLSNMNDQDVAIAIDTAIDVLKASDQVEAASNQNASAVTKQTIDLVKPLLTNGLSDSAVSKLDALLSKVRFSAVTGEIKSDDGKVSVAQATDNPYELTVSTNGSVAAVAGAVRIEGEDVNIVVTQQLIDDLAAGKADAIQAFSEIVGHETAEMAFENNHTKADAFNGVVGAAAVKLASSANIKEANDTIKALAAKGDKAGNEAALVDAITQKALAGEAVGPITVARSTEAKIDNDMSTEETTNLNPQQQKEVADAAVSAAQNKLGVANLPQLVEKTYKNLAAASNMTLKTLNLATGPAFYLLDESALDANMEAMAAALKQKRSASGRTAENINVPKVIHATARKAAPISKDAKTGNPVISPDVTGKFIETINKRSNGKVTGVIYVSDEDVAAVSDTLGISLSKASIVKLYEEAFAAYNVKVKEIGKVQDLIDSEETQKGDVILVAADQLKSINAKGTEKKVIGTNDATNFARMADMIEEALTNDLDGMTGIMTKLYSATLINMGIEAGSDAYNAQMKDFGDQVRNKGVFAFLETPAVAVVEQLNFELITAVQVDIAA